MAYSSSTTFPFFPSDSFIRIDNSSDSGYDNAVADWNAAYLKEHRLPDDNGYLVVKSVPDSGATRLVEAFEWYQSPYQLRVTAVDSSTNFITGTLSYDLPPGGPSPIAHFHGRLPVTNTFSTSLVQGSARIYRTGNQLYLHLDIRRAPSGPLNRIFSIYTLRGQRASSNEDAEVVASTLTQEDGTPTGIAGLDPAFVEQIRALSVALKV
ncbi:hypothetical protein SISSUDRAFT_1038190 [Sistotremastrum suecicum HHB10207 ss-3]|uniref:Uncharacterized protein n=1 Tax=Sistotremastrum suecicum HHB10207 ss-3 TaxID=1314776 RepID=A0A165X3Y5_9AGAM|nr:hypothetical protein SISSUDRAFT_1038190 [Sistotremastrum suecicum HHB10207 ss-3]